ncbi:MAG: glycolate oxidase subunit GlcE [Thiotrichaceae bacterium]|nr:glycolate oxidase subunit GlcE [Thiotrichaceae bacterium]
MSTVKQLQQQIQTALDKKSPLFIQGGGSKAFYGNPVDTNNRLITTDYNGIVDYQPSELFVTVKAGTTLIELEQVLAEKQQQLTFEAPIFKKETTIGGVVSAGLSGPRSAYAGSIRDSVLGVKIINGHGEIVSFGGQVMKNVAGYDMSRLMAGSLGTLGLILEVSLKVLPKPEVEMTLMLPCPHEEAIENFNELRQSGLPISASCYIDSEIFVRIAGQKDHLNALIRRHRWKTYDQGDRFWESIRNHTHLFFNHGNMPLWRLSVSPASAINGRLNTDTMIEWGGGVRWVNSNTPANIIVTSAQKKGGHAILFRGAIPGVRTFPTPDPEVLKIHQNLKYKLDPKGIFNPGRIY